MRVLKLLSAALCAGAVAAQKSWAGTNSYFLPGLPQAKQVAHIEQLRDMGVRVLRLWVREQPPPFMKKCEKGSLRGDVEWCSPFEHYFAGGLGQYDYSALDVLDQTLANVIAHGGGMKVILSPHDANNIYA